MGSSNPSSGALQATPAQIATLSKTLPDLLKAYGANALPYEQALLNTSKVIDPQKLQETLKNYLTYGPTFSGIQSDELRRQALANANIDLAVTTGPGRDLTKEVLASQKLIDPEYFQNRAYVAARSRELADSIGINEPTGSEMAETERQLLRIAGPDRSNSRLLSAANVFGDRSLQRKDTLSRALANITGSLPALRSGIDAFQIGSAKPSGGNLNTFGLNSTAGNLGANVSQAGGGLLSNIYGTNTAASAAEIAANQLAQQRRQNNTNLGVQVASLLKPSGVGGGSTGFAPAPGGFGFLSNF